MIYHPGTGDIDRAMELAVGSPEDAVAMLRSQLEQEWADVMPVELRHQYEHAWAVAFVNRLQTLPGTGRRDVLTDLLEHWDAHVADEVDDNSERNPHVGFVPADKSGLVDDLMRWRGGDLNDSVSPFAIHTVIVNAVPQDKSVAGFPEWRYTVRHPVDCDRLPYGERCAFDMISDDGESIEVPASWEAGEYEAHIRSTDSIAGAGEEYIEISSTPVVRES